MKLSGRFELIMRPQAAHYHGEIAAQLGISGNKKGPSHPPAKRWRIGPRPSPPIRKLFLVEGLGVAKFLKNIATIICFIKANLGC